MLKRNAAWLLRRFVSRVLPLGLIPMVVITVSAITTIADAGVAANPDPLFHEEFSTNAMAQWTVSTNLTVGYTQICPGGNSSATCLEIVKQDWSGSLAVSRRVTVPPDRFLRVSADLQTLRVSPSSTFSLSITQFDQQGNRIADDRFGFNSGDGIPRKQPADGIGIAPQTLNEWRTTRHVVYTKAGVSTVVVGFSFAGGAQHFRLDNVKIEDLGSDKPKPELLPIYVRNLDRADALLDLDILIPGVTYELTAKTEGQDHSGYGVQITAVDLHGRKAPVERLLPFKEDNEALMYRLTVPENAVVVQFDFFFNCWWGVFGAEEKPRRGQWKEISLRPLIQPPMTDHIFNKYRQKRESDIDLIKPREIVEATEYDRQRLIAHLAKRETVDAEVKNQRGGMTILIGGKAVPPMICSQQTPGEFDVSSELGRRGLDLTTVENKGSGPGFNGQWLAPGKYDFSSVDDVIYRALKLNPDAYIIFDSKGLYPPYWWGEANPDQIMQDPEGLSLSIRDHTCYARMWGKMEGGALHRTHEEFYAGDQWLRNQGNIVDTTYFPSPASRSYRQAIKDYLVALRRHIEQQPYGKAVIGYALTWGFDLQWGYPITGSGDITIGKPGKDPHDVDFSKPMRKHFQKFLQTQYGTVAALQAAWRDPRVTFATAEIPGPEQQSPDYVKLRAGQRGLKFLLDPAQDAAALDYKQCSQRIIGEMADEFGCALKAAAPRKIITKIYLMDLCRDLGHDFVLRGSGLDIIGGPPGGVNIGVATGSQNLTQSYTLHGKIDFEEVDFRVFPTGWRDYQGNPGFETPRKSISVLQREYARQMCLGGGVWTLDMGCGWFSHPIIADTLGDIRKVFQEVLPFDRNSVAQAAVFMANEDWNVSAWPWPTYRPYYLNMWFRSVLPYIGTPVDLYHLSDLSAVRSKYKMFIFPFAYHLTDQQRCEIDQLKHNGNLLIFGPAAGYAGDRKMSVDYVAQLTGMKLRQDDALPPTVKVTNDRHPITQRLAGHYIGEGASEDAMTFPKFHVTDERAVTLGEYIGAGAGKTGLAYKDHGDWQSVYIGAMGWFPPELFRGCALMAKLHIYSEDGDVMYFAKNLIAIHAASAGMKTIELPRPAQVKSLWDQAELGRLKTIKRLMRSGDNALYLVTP